MKLEYGDHVSSNRGLTWSVNAADNANWAADDWFEEGMSPDL